MPTISNTVLRYEKRDHKAYLTLNRPEVMNAINSEMGEAIASAVKDAEQDDDVLVLIVIGEGGKAFSAGADLKQKNRKDPTVRTNVLAGCRRKLHKTHYRSH